MPRTGWMHCTLMQQCQMQAAGHTCRQQAMQAVSLAMLLAGGRVQGRTNLDSEK